MALGAVLVSILAWTAPATLLVSILALTAPATLWPEFSLSWTDVAAQKNLEILRAYAMNLAAALQAQPFSSLSLGSEFYPANILEPLCGLHHCGLARVKQWLQTGVNYPLKPISEDDWLVDLHAKFEKGNHQLAMYNFEQLVSMLTEEGSIGAMECSVGTTRFGRPGIHQ